MTSRVSRLVAALLISHSQLTYTCAYIHMYTHVHIYAYTHTYIYLYIYIWGGGWYVYIYIFKQVLLKTKATRTLTSFFSRFSILRTPVAWGDQNSANVCSCACRKRRLIIGYKLSNTTGLLYAWSSCMQWGVWVWTVGHWVVLVQVIYCSKGGWVIFFKKNQWHPWEEIMSYSHSRKPDIK